MDFGKIMLNETWKLHSSFRYVEKKLLDQLWYCENDAFFAIFSKTVSFILKLLQTKVVLVYHKIIYKKMRLHSS